MGEKGGGYGKEGLPLAAVLDNQCKPAQGALSRAHSFLPESDTSAVPAQPFMNGLASQERTAQPAPAPASRPICLEEDMIA